VGPPLLALKPRLVNRHFATLAALEQAQEARCRVLHNDPELIKAATTFWWWPQAL
jgi:hypothetical protein